MTDGVSHISALDVPRKRTAAPYLGLRYTLLVLLLFSFTVLPDIWIGPAPLWLIFSGFAVGLAMVDRTLANDIARVARALTDPIVVPWLCAVVAFAVIDAVRATGDFERVTLLNLFQLMTMVLAAALAYRTPPRVVIYAIGLIAAGEGLLCIGQIMQVSVAWKVPDLLQRISSHVQTDPSEMAGDYADIFRVRGTLQFVHKFNAMQGMLAAFLLCAVFERAQLLEELRIKYVPLVICAALGLIGVLLTFSRSTWFALGVIFVYLIYRSRMKIGGTRLLVGMVIFGSLVYLVAFSSSPILGRLTDFSAESSTNTLRYSQLDYGLGVLTSSPLYGEPIPVHTGDFPVHSVALRKFIDYGFLGFLPYAFTILGIGMTLLKFARSRNVVASFLGQAGIAVFLVAMIDSSTHSAGILHTDVMEAPLIGLLFGLMFGAAPAIIASAPRRRRVGAPAMDGPADPDRTSQ